MFEEASSKFLACFTLIFCVSEVFEPSCGTNLHRALPFHISVGLKVDDSLLFNFGFVSSPAVNLLLLSAIHARG